MKQPREARLRRSRPLPLGGRGWGGSSPPHAQRGAARQRGFTLVEVLVALVVVAVTLGAGIQAAGALTNNAERLAGITAAQWCADNRLTGIKLARGQFLDIGDTEFTCEQLGRAYKGRQVVRPTPNPNFRRVDARLFDENGQPLLTLSPIVGRS